MIKFVQDDLLYLSSTFSKLLKRKFGKGPETCLVMIKGSRLYVYMRSFITPAEEVLKNQDELNLAIQFRSAVMSSVTKEFILAASTVLGNAFDNFLHDWNYETNTGILVLEKAAEIHERLVDVSIENTLFSKLKDIGARYHKQPASLKVVKYTHNICAIESKEVLLKIESLVYEKGNIDVLLHYSREVKSGYYKHKGVFEDLFNRLIDDIFILWDYEGDRNYLIFVFKKEEYLVN